MGFTERLTELTAERGSMARLSETTGLSTGLLSNYKNGTDPSLKNAVKIADALDVSLDYLAGRDGYAPEPRRSPAGEGAPEPRYADPRQEALNGYYESMNDSGRGALVESARLMSGSPDTRIEKDGPEPASLPSQMAV